MEMIDNMNLLYISQIGDMKWAGPTYSIPKQIEAQSKYDNVFWYHIKKDVSLDWISYQNFNSLHEFPKGKISDLPEPFNKPDLVIVEQFYGYAISSIKRELVNGNIPYIIIPRGELTEKAQNRKKLKKKIANIISFNKFASKALAIQYLTEDERKNSGEMWNATSIVISNGTEKKDIIKEKFNKDKLICTSIGRLESYQKGLDLLIDACVDIKEELIKAKCEIHIYGPDVENQRYELEERIKENDLGTVMYIHDGVFGNEKRQILLDSDVFMMTSRFEGHPMALIEAMSYGIPCFATYGTNMSEEINKTDSGWIASTDVESIRKSILKMIKERDNLEVKGDNALSLSNEYNWDEIAKKSHSIYEELLALKSIEK